MFIRQCECRGATGMFLVVFFSQNAFRSVLPSFSWLFLLRKYHLFVNYIIIYNDV